MATYGTLAGRVTIVGGSVGSVHSISGVIYAANGSTPLSGATITLGAYSTTSAVDGTYTLSNVPAGTSGSMTCTLTNHIFTAISVSALAGNLIGQNYTSKIFIYDTFTGADSTALNSHTPDIMPVGSSWIISSGSAAIQSNRAQLNAAVVWIQSNTADGIISSVVNANSTGNVGIIFRATDATHRYQATFNTGSPGTFRIQKIDTSASDIAASTPTLNINTDYTMTITLSGNSISAVIAGVSGGTLNVTDSFNNTATLHGYRGANSADKFDDFTVRTP